MAAESASQAAESASQVAPGNMESISAITNLSAFKQVISNEEAEKQVRVLTKLFINTARGAGEKKICLLHNQQWLQTAKEVSTWYSDRRIPVERQSYEEARWFESVKQSACTHFIFFGYPSHERQKRRGIRSAKSPIESSTAISAFFTPKDGAGNTACRRVNEVVVVLGDRLSTRKDHKSRFGDHYLERYLKLHFLKEPAVVAASALGIFAGQSLACVYIHVHLHYWYMIIYMTVQYKQSTYQLFFHSFLPFSPSLLRAPACPVAHRQSLLERVSETDRGLSTRS